MIMMFIRQQMLMVMLRYTILSFPKKEIIFLKMIRKLSKCAKTFQIHRNFPDAYQVFVPLFSSYPLILLALLLFSFLFLLLYPFSRLMFWFLLFLPLFVTFFLLAHFFPSFRRLPHVAIPLLIWKFCGTYSTCSVLSYPVYVILDSDVESWTTTKMKTRMNRLASLESTQV